MIINMKSDTQTLPTDAMMEAIGNAVLGDDVYASDPTVNELERLAAKMMGKESALFVPSGTMGNLCALMAHTRRGDEVLMEAESHIYYYEVGGFALAGLSPRLVLGRNGIMNPKDVECALRGKNIHYPDTSLLCIENTHNRGGGTVTSVALTEELCEIAHQHNLKVHIDGARIFNAALALDVNVVDLVKPADSVMFCVSKGLSAPVGSLLVGTQGFIEKSRKTRKLLGGGMRQAGVLAAAGIVAISQMVSRLEEDHRNARVLAEGLATFPEIELDMATVQTNIVQFDITRLGISSNEFAKMLLNLGLQVSTRPPTKIRMVTHRHISSVDIDKALKILRDTIQNIRI